MYSKFETLLIKRFLFSKKTDGYISIFSWFSIFGIMIGVAAIIIVMAVMNGFREELTSRLLGINGHINIFSKTGKIEQNKIDILNEYNSNNTHVFPLIETQALLIADDKSKGVYLRGYETKHIKNKKLLVDSIIKGKIFSDNFEDIIIGYALSNSMNLDVGDKIKIAIPKSDKTIFGNIPRFKTLKISGIFNLGMYEYDSNFIFSSSILPRKLLILGNGNFNSVEIITDNPDKVEIIQKQIDSRLETLNNSLYTLSWKEINFSLINALKVERNVMFLILTLIILVASMNIISGLIIFVKEKNKDIGILKTIGLNNISFIKIFITMGFIIGLIGTTFGAIFGILFAKNISSIQFFLEKLLKTNLFSKEIYYLSSLPSSINFYEVIYVIIISLIISLFSTFFPAYRSLKIDPIKSLKND